jgi:hypothetical protein
MLAIELAKSLRIVSDHTGFFEVFYRCTVGLTNPSKETEDLHQGECRRGVPTKPRHPALPRSGSGEDRGFVGFLKSLPSMRSNLVGSFFSLLIQKRPLVNRL